MPKKLSIDLNAIANYCFEPRKISDICTQFLMSSPQTHRVMNKLVWSNLVAERMMKGRGLQYKLFLRIDLDTENAWERTETNEDVIPSHDPFGLTNRLALKLKQQGVSIEKFAKQYTRQIRMLDIDPENVRKITRKVWGKNT